MAAAVLLVVVAAAVLFVRSRDEGLAISSASDNVVPFSFSYPDGWQREEQGHQVMFSPHAREMLPLFASLGAAGSWAETNALVERSPSEVVGLFTWFDTTRQDGSTVDQIQDNLQNLLPQEVQFSPARERAVVGGYTADRLEGELREPGGQGAGLRFQCYLVHVQPPEAKSVYLVFFSSTTTFDSNRELFRRITESVKF